MIISTRPLPPPGEASFLTQIRYRSDEGSYLTAHAYKQSAMSPIGAR